MQVSTTWALTCPETVHQRPCMMRETWLSDSSLGSVMCSNNVRSEDRLAASRATKPLDLWWHCMQLHCTTTTCAQRALLQLSATHCRQLTSTLTLLLCVSLGLRHSSSPGISLFPLLSCTLPGPSASEVTALWRYTNMFIVISSGSSIIRL